MKRKVVCEIYVPNEKEPLFKWLFSVVRVGPPGLEPGTP